MENQRIKNNIRNRLHPNEHKINLWIHSNTHTKAEGYEKCFFTKESQLINVEIMKEIDLFFWPCGMAGRILGINPYPPTVEACSGSPTTGLPGNSWHIFIFKHQYNHLFRQKSWMDGKTIECRFLEYSQGFLKVLSHSLYINFKVEKILLQCGDL